MVFRSSRQRKAVMAKMRANVSIGRFKNKIVFLENYNLEVARYLVSGCDLWLNNPRRPLEASGTSGMKVVTNGGLNFSVLDGWWDEAFTPDLGWKIGDRKNSFNGDFKDEKDINDLYNVLEKEIIPLYFNRDEQNLPNMWINVSLTLTEW